MKEETIYWKTLTPEQRNEIVAEKVMGWVPKECDGEIGAQSISPDGWFCQKCGVKGGWGDEFTHEERARPYSQHIGIAWLIVRHFTVGVTLEYIPGRDCTCKISGTISEPVYGIAENPAEAICIAALRACDIDVRQ